MLPRSRWFRVTVPLILVAAASSWLLFLRRRSPDDPPPPPEHVAPAKDAFALLIGCTEYPVLENLGTREHYESSVRLLGPGNDVALMFDVLRRYLGVPEVNITRLTGWDPVDAASRPTRANILSHLDRLARDVPRGAHVLVLYSGHGSQQADDNGDETDGGLDEILLPADAGGWDAEANHVRNVITDDEIGARLTAIRDAGADVWAVFDCCHSATAMRSVAGEVDRPASDFGEVRVRRVEPASLGIPPDRIGVALGSRGFAGVGGVAPKKAPASRGLAMISAVQSSQQAPEFVLPLDKRAEGRRPQGLLTFEIARALQRELGGVSLAELFRHVEKAYERVGWRGVRPYADGDLSMRAMPGERGAGSQLLLRRVSDRLVLDAGSLRGLTVGSHLEVYRRGKFMDESALIGRLTVTEVEPMRSICAPEAGGPDPATIPDGAPCRIVDVAPGGPPLRIAWVDERGEAVAAMSRGSRASPLDARARAAFPTVPPAEADWLARALPIGSDGIARCILAPARTETGIEPLEIATDALAATLERIRRAESLRGWAANGPLSRLPRGVRAEAWCRRRGADDDEPLGPDATLTPGDRIRLHIENGTGRDIDVVVFSLDASQTDTRQWPVDGVSRRITPEESGVVKSDWLPINDDGMGRESLVLVVATFADGASRLDVGGLTGAAVGSSPDAIPARQGERVLLDTIAPPGATRGIDDKPIDSVAVREFAWTTTWGRIGIPKELLAEMAALDPPAAFPAAAAGAIAPPGRDVRWTKAKVIPGSARTADVLLLSGEGATAGNGAIGILIDGDGDAGLVSDDPAEAARRAVASRLPVELMLVLEPGGSSAAYPRERGDVELGHVRSRLSSREDRAERRFDLTGGGWVGRATCAPWLSTSFVPALDEAARARIESALRSVCLPR